MCSGERGGILSRERVSAGRGGGGGRSGRRSSPNIRDGPAALVPVAPGGGSSRAAHKTKGTGGVSKRHAMRVERRRGSTYACRSPGDRGRRLWGGTGFPHQEKEVGRVRGGGRHGSSAPPTDGGVAPTGQLPPPAGVWQVGLAGGGGWWWPAADAQQPGPTGGSRVAAALRCAEAARGTGLQAGWRSRRHSGGVGGGPKRERGGRRGGGRAPAGGGGGAEEWELMAAHRCCCSSLERPPPPNRRRRWWRVVVVERHPAATLAANSLADERGPTELAGRRGGRAEGPAGRPPWAERPQGTAVGRCQQQQRARVRKGGLALHWPIRRFVKGKRAGSRRWLQLQTGLVAFTPPPPRPPRPPPLPASPAAHYLGGGLRVSHPPGRQARGQRCRHVSQGQSPAHAQRPPS